MSDENIILNLSGSKFEISTGVFFTIKSMQSPASAMLKQCWNPSSRKEILLERQSIAFSAILPYFQGRKLHMPLSVCPLDFQEELEFWGIDPSVMSKCCFSRYCAFFDEQQVLAILDNDQLKRLREQKSLQDRTMGTGWRSVQAKVWMVLEEPSTSVLAKIFFVLSSIFVMVSIFALVCGTHPTFKRSLRVSEWRDYFGSDFSKFEGHFSDSVPVNTTLPPLPLNVRTNVDALVYIEYITVTYFTFEIILRLIFCPSNLRFFTSFLNWIDIIALVVMYSKYFANLSNPKEKYTASIFDTVHCLQIIRVFRGFRVLLYAVRASAFEVFLMSMFLLVAMLMFSAFAFFSGDESFPSIPDSFWWAIVTMTTVGYGDMYPKIGLSKFVGAVCAVTGVCLIAVIIPIFVNNFILFYVYSKIWERKDKPIIERDSYESKKIKFKINKIDAVPSVCDLKQAN
ncbi:hypothetical protein KUTeg_010199 [Tegillarca granosa]|uniref:Uncharacterized protein n=1 Tax=Tegillarca granosa TaxID=220873 RepID=A0ABQ9F8A8_TEGGR|nr:hypothetical protein KUTeg_010199 [Tegillarca granosa]